MPKNLAGKTYEVFTADGKRWIIDSEHPTRSAALEHAEGLLTAGNHDGVRVVSLDGAHAVFELRAGADALVKALARFTVERLGTEGLSLEELFRSYYQRPEASPPGVGEEEAQRAAAS